MRAIGLIAVLASLPAASGALAQALPPPPYQNDPAFAAPAAPTAHWWSRKAPSVQAQAVPAPTPWGAAPRMDRYGGVHRPEPAMQGSPGMATGVPGGAPAPAPGAYLAWSGKAQLAALHPTGGQAQTGGWTAMTDRWDPRAAPQTQTQTQTQAQSSEGWRPLYPQSPAPSPPAVQPAPTSIYDPVPAPASAQQAQAPAAPQAPAYPLAPPDQRAPYQRAPYQRAQAERTDGPRFYSLHRDYGIAPDAIPLPPQFFGATADLSAPPADPVVRRTTTTGGQTRTTAVPEADAGQ